MTTYKRKTTESFQLIDMQIVNEYFEPNGTVWSDRLYQWDYEKYNRLCRKYFGDEKQTFNDRKPKDIEKFLEEYIGADELILCKIHKDTHQAYGYPIWRFDYYT